MQYLLTIFGVQKLLTLKKKKHFERMWEIRVRKNKEKGKKEDEGNEEEKTGEKYGEKW